MTWLLPAALGVGLAAIAAVTALHLLAQRRPKAELLPTARFVPERTTRVASRAVALTDPWLLLLRVAALAALALGFAQPVLAPARTGTARVILADRSRDVASMAEVRGRVRALARPGDVVIAFDSAAHAAAPDSIAASTARGSLGAALLAGERAAASIAGRADSVELVLVSPLAAAEVDAATASIRARWPGGVRAERVARARGSAAAARTRPAVLGAQGDDALAAGLALLAPPATEVRVRRDAAAGDDSAWVAAGSGRVVLRWPVNAAPPSGVALARADTIGGVAAGDALVVAPFSRRVRLEGAAVARWSDGAPAATERALGSGCVRDVAIPLDGAADLVLRPSFQRLLARLVAPCGRVADSAPNDSVDAATVAATLRLRGGAVPAASIAATGAARAPWGLPLVLLGVALLVAELGLRARAGGGSPS